MSKNERDDAEMARRVLLRFRPESAMTAEEYAEWLRPHLTG